MLEVPHRVLAQAEGDRPAVLAEGVAREGQGVLAVAAQEGVPLDEIDTAVLDQADGDDVVPGAAVDHIAGEGELGVALAVEADAAEGPEGDVDRVAAAAGA